MKAPNIDAKGIASTLRRPTGSATGRVRDPQPIVTSSWDTHSEKQQSSMFSKESRSDHSDNLTACWVR